MNFLTKLQLIYLKHITLNYIEYQHLCLNIQGASKKRGPFGNFQGVIQCVSKKMILCEKMAKIRNPENALFLKKPSTTFSKNSFKFQI